MGCVISPRWHVRHPGFQGDRQACMREDAARRVPRSMPCRRASLNPPQARPRQGQLPPPDRREIRARRQKTCSAWPACSRAAEWRGGRCIKKGAEAKDNSAARLAVLKAQADAEFRLLKTGLDQRRPPRPALDDRLVSIRDYYAQKTRFKKSRRPSTESVWKTEERTPQQMARSGRTEATLLRAWPRLKPRWRDCRSGSNAGEIEVANAHAGGQYRTATRQ